MRTFTCRYRRVEIYPREGCFSQKKSLFSFCFACILSSAISCSKTLFHPNFVFSSRNWRPLKIFRISIFFWSRYWDALTALDHNTLHKSPSSLYGCWWCFINFWLPCFGSNYVLDFTEKISVLNFSCCFAFMQIRGRTSTRCFSYQPWLRPFLYRVLGHLLLTDWRFCNFL